MCGWTQDVFAHKSGFHRALVGAFEQGEINLTLASFYSAGSNAPGEDCGIVQGVEG